MNNRTDTIKVNVPYHQVPNSIFEIGLRSNEITVLHYLYRCGNQGSRIFPSHATIANKCGISKRTVINILARLSNKEYDGKPIIIKKQRQNESADYYSNEYFIELPVIRGGSEINALGSEINALGSEINAHYKERTYKEILTKNQTTTKAKKIKKSLNKEYIDQLKDDERFKDLDIDSELENFNAYNEGTGRVLKSERLGFLKWLKQAIEYKKNGNQPAGGPNRKGKTTAVPDDDYYERKAKEAYQL